MELNINDYNVSIMDILMYELNYTEEEAQTIVNDNGLEQKEVENDQN